MYYGHEAGFLRIAELRQKANAERRARELCEAGNQQHETSGRAERRVRRLWSRVA